MASAATLRAGGGGRSVLADHVRLPVTSVVADVLLVLGGVLLLTAATQIRIPLGFTPVPLTGQTFAVLLVGAGLGPMRGGLSVLLYVLVGLAGAPVFTNGGSGIGHLIGATGGYLVGFVIASVLAGAFARRRFDRRVGTAVIAMSLASLVIYACGVLGLMVATGASIPRALELGVLPFLVVDAVKVLLAAAVLPAAWIAVPDIERGRR